MDRCWGVQSRSPLSLLRTVHDRGVPAARCSNNNLVRVLFSCPDRSSTTSAGAGVLGCAAVRPCRRALADHLPDACCAKVSLPQSASTVCSLEYLPCNCSRRESCSVRNTALWCGSHSQKHIFHKFAGTFEFRLSECRLKAVRSVTSAYTHRHHTCSLLFTLAAMFAVRLWKVRPSAPADQTYTASGNSKAMLTHLPFCKKLKTACRLRLCWP